MAVLRAHEFVKITIYIYVDIIVQVRRNFTTPRLGQQFYTYWLKIPTTKC